MADQTSIPGEPAVVPVTLIDIDNEPDQLSLTATSSNPSIVAPNGIAISGAGANRVVTLTAEPEANGLTTIILTVADPDGKNAIEPFNVTFLQTTAAQTRWDGNLPIGSIGDGTTWQDNNNWSRDGQADEGPLKQSPGDDLIFAAIADADVVVNSQGSQLANSLRFEADYTLEGGPITVSSGNIIVNDQARAELPSIVGPQGIRKQGLGTLLFEDDVEGDVILEQGTLGGNGSMTSLTALEATTVSPGSSLGILTVSDNAIIGGELLVEVGDLAGRPTHGETVV